MQALLCEPGETAEWTFRYLFVSPNTFFTCSR